MQLQVLPAGNRTRVLWMRSSITRGRRVEGLGVAFFATAPGLGLIMYIITTLEFPAHYILYCLLVVILFAIAYILHSFLYCVLFNSSMVKASHGR